jgi:hypothetical protein
VIGDLIIQQETLAGGQPAGQARHQAVEPGQPIATAAARRPTRRRQDHRDEPPARLDDLVARLTGGLTAGESLLLDDQIADHRPLDVANLLAWHDGLPPVAASAEAPIPRLVAAIRLARGR